LEPVNRKLLQQLKPEEVEVDVVRAEVVEEPEETGVEESELDEMWSFVGNKSNPRWLWHAIDRRTGQVLAFAFGRRQDQVLEQLKELLEPFGIKRYCIGSCPTKVWDR
jgi:insertion element IS1 protein InsB